MCKIILIAVILPLAWVGHAIENNNINSHAESMVSFNQPSPIQENQLMGLTVATIGSDVNCTYQAGTGVVQTAIDAGFNEIRLVKGTHSGNIEIFDTSVGIKGRYLNCLLAANDVPSNFIADNSIISGVTGAALPTIRIGGDSIRNLVQFTNLNIRNGEPSATILTGGGIDVRQADVIITFNQVQIMNNQGKLGGGLSVFGGSSRVLINDSILTFNSAQEGGGIYCFGNEVDIFMNDTGPENPSGIGLNSATNGNGGGLYIWGGCDFTSTSGSYGLGGFDVNGIVLNSATGHGGGVYVSSGGQVTLDGAKVCLPNEICSGTNEANVRVTGNTANSDNNNDGSGGGIYATGQQTSINLINAVVADNTAYSGGGLSANEKAEINMSSYYTNIRELVRCWSPGSCSQITSNIATTLGGGVEVRTGSYVFLDRTVVKQNRANNANALYIRSEPGSDDISVVDLVGSLVTNNGDGGNGTYADATVITLTGGQIFTRYTTFADNDVESAVILSGAGGLLDIDSSIIHQLDGIPTYLAFNPNSLSAAKCLMVSTLDDFDGFNFIDVNDPMFVNRGAGDFHLSDASPAIDECLRKNSNSTTIDLDEDLRGWDDPAVSNFEGITADMGYDENYRYIADLIFKDGFETLN